MTGSVLFGGVDTAKFTGSLIALPIQKGANGTYTDITVALTSFSLTDATGKTAYTQNNLALPVILDSGTTDTYLPDNIANDLFAGVGVINDNRLGPIVPCKIASSPAKFNFAFGGNGGPSISVSLSEFVTPVYLDDGSIPQFRDGSGDICTFGILSSGTPDQPILLGDSFLRSAYVVYDLANNQVGLAQTVFNATDTKVVEISDKNIPGVSATATDVAVTQSYTGHPLQQTAKTKGGSQFTGGAKSPTFNLGAGATGTSGSGGQQKGMAGQVGPPRGVAVGLLGGLVLVLSMMLGGSLILVR